MGDSGTMTATSSPVGHNDASVTVASDAAGSIAPATENVAGAAPACISDTGEIVPSAGSVNAADSVAHALKMDAGIYATTVNVTQQETPAVTAYDANENFAGLANSSLDSTQVAGYDSSLNGNGVSEAGDRAASVSENGVASADGIGSAALHQALDGSGIYL